MNYSSEHLNRIVKDNKFKDLIELSEARHIMQFENLVRMIVESHRHSLEKNITDAVLITGPSSSGKTTTSRLLSSYLKNEGFNTILVSFDDYYHDLDDICKMQNKPLGTKADQLDLECPEAFDIEYFKNQMNDFLRGKEITLPRYDFLDKKRKDGNRIVPTDRDVIIVEGIHALNPILTDGVNFSKLFKVYICPFDNYFVPGREGLIYPKDIRFMRRSIRDRVDRGSSLINTMNMWQSVRNGEETYIKPMKKFADFFFNSSLEYEICLLKYRFTEMLNEIDKNELLELNKMFPFELLKHFPDVANALIPETSIFREFYK